LSGEVKLFSLKDLTAKAFIDKLERLIEREGPPRYIIGDSAKQFLGEAMKELLIKYDIEFEASTAYRHQGNAKWKIKPRQRRSYCTQ